MDETEKLIRGYEDSGLLTQQCSHTIRITRFCDPDYAVAYICKEFRGSLLKQAKEAYDFLMLNNRKKSVIAGLKRIDTMDYPEEAVKEALLNAVIHRDYTFSGSILINITDAEIEIISLGGLVNGLSELDVMNGISQSRNPKLAEAFHNLHMAESCGTGIRRIFSLYDGSTRKPQLMIAENSFRIVLPNINF